MLILWEWKNRRFINIQLSIIEQLQLHHTLYHLNIYYNDFIWRIDQQSEAHYQNPATN